MTDQTAADGVRMRTYTVPLPGKRVLFVEGPFPMTLADWEYAMSVLDVMKPGLVHAVADEPAESATA